MGAYLLRRLFLVIPTLWAIITINFFIVQIAPGGPVDQAIANIELGHTTGFTAGSGDGGLGAKAGLNAAQVGDSNYRGSRGLDPEVIAEIKQRFGFDKPLHQRYFDMLWRYVRFDFGDSLFRGESVMSLIKQSLPVSISLGLWSTLIIYLVSIPLGIKSGAQWHRLRYLEQHLNYHRLCNPLVPIRYFTGSAVFRWELFRSIPTPRPGFQ